MPTPPPETAPTAKMIIVLNRRAGGDRANGLETKLGELFRANGTDARILHAGEGIDLNRLLAGKKGAV